MTLDSKRTITTHKGAKAASSFAGMSVVILGLARQGMALARFLVAEGAQVTVSDMATAARLGAEVSAAEELGVSLALGGHPLELLDGCDLLCLSGGVPAQIEIVQEAIRRGIPLSNDSLITIQRARQLGLGPIIAITGSSGKTTTTTLVGEMLRRSEQTVHVGGNIGTPLIDRMEVIRPGEPIVLELSSFQLELFDPAIAYTGKSSKSKSAITGVDVAAILNVTPNHLDRHPNMAAYGDAKFNLLRTLPAGATVVLCADDAVTGQIAKAAGARIAPPALPDAWQMQELVEEMGALLRHKKIRVLTFGQRCGDANALTAGIQSALTDNHIGDENHNDDNIAEQGRDALMFNRTVFTHRGEVRLRGDHNITNVLGAAAISGGAGATIQAMTSVAQSFEGVRHRLEIVKEIGGVTWINDSIATSPERAVAGLRAFDPAQCDIILLAGGKDKKLPWEAFAAETLARVSFLIGFGDAGAMIVEKVRATAEQENLRLPGMAVVNRLDEAVELAARSVHTGGAKAESVVLLSPGGTSYDAYRDFEARGEHFRELVEQYAPLAQGSTPLGSTTQGSKA